MRSGFVVHRIAGARIAQIQICDKARGVCRRLFIAFSVTETYGLGIVVKQIFRSGGFSMPETLMATATATLLISIAVPTYNSYVDDAKTSEAIGDMGRISLQIERFRANNNDALPVTLGEVGLDDLLDPWGNPYIYGVMVNAPDTAAARQDSNSTALNTDYDLYSIGEDGRTRPRITDDASRDDVIRAHDGAYIGRVDEIG